MSSLVSFQLCVWQSRAASPWHFLYRMGSSLKHNNKEKLQISQINIIIIILSKHFFSCLSLAKADASSSSLSLLCFPQYRYWGKLKFPYRSDSITNISTPIIKTKWRLASGSYNSKNSLFFHFNNTVKKCTYLIHLYQYIFKLKKQCIIFPFIYYFTCGLCCHNHLCMQFIILQRSSYINMFNSVSISLFIIISLDKKNLRCSFGR